MNLEQLTETWDSNSVSSTSSSIVECDGDEYTKTTSEEQYNVERTD